MAAVRAQHSPFVAAVCELHLAQRARPGLHKSAAAKAVTVPLSSAQVWEAQCLAHLPGSFFALTFLLLMPLALPFGSLSLPLQTLALAFFGLLNAKPIHKGMLTAETNRVHAHLNRQAGSAANRANYKNRFTSQLGQSLGLLKLLHQHVAQIFGRGIFAIDFTRKPFSMSTRHTKNIAQVIQELLRLCFYPSRQLQCWIGTVDGEVRQITHLWPT